MSSSERETQNRVVQLFRQELGYRYVGDWHDREGNSNIEEPFLADHLKRAGYSDQQISRAIEKLKRDANDHSRKLYHNNKAVYGHLRYGIGIKTGAGMPTETVQLIDWQNPENNDWVIAEEVTLSGPHDRRPDLVLYLNGLAIAAIELKSSRVSIGEGIRQLLSNQREDFHAWFFSTVQLVFAGSDSEGLKYGTIGTPEKYFLKWKEDEADNSRFKLDKYLLKMCAKDRLLELMHDFILFDAGIKKVPRFHQYFGIKAAQPYVDRREGGIIWHTQGSGKSIVMVLLAKWILENYPGARVVIITDRDELDKQIEGVFSATGESIYRARSGQDLLRQLDKPAPRLLCTLIHKFGRNDDQNIESLVRDLEAAGGRATGELFCFVDECHRTNDKRGVLHRLMKATMPEAVFVGFTGTPLLKSDRAESREVFGHYIHTYKFSEAVDDGVVLDLMYEARDIDQKLSSPQRVDQWFEAKTRALNDWQKEELMKKWGTMQKVLSSQSRIEKVVADVTFDFSTKPRLSSQRGNAILVASSIYEACKYFRAFQSTEFKGKCALVTSYDPQARNVSKEETGANTQAEKQFVYDLYMELLEPVAARPGQSKASTYEDIAKETFIDEPAHMRLLIVVDKLLTGFDAPPCTYLYLDKSMRDHGLFQAICRTNRLDGDDKEFGYVIDYKNLFDNVKKAISVYSSELDDSSGGEAPDVLMQNRLERGKERLDAAREALTVLCEPVEPPRSDLEYIHFFCGNTEIESDLENHEPQRTALYKGVVRLVRAYANVADEMEEAGYSDHEAEHIKRGVDEYVKLRDMIRQASGETIDLKAYEADMRHLIDTYISADEPRKISPFDDLSLTELIVKTGIADAIASKLGGLHNNHDAVAETIENNVRSKIIREHLNDPAFYEKMSELLDEIIALRKEKAIEYADYLKRIAALVLKVENGAGDGTPNSMNTPGKRALYHNLDENEELALRLHEAIINHRPEGFRGSAAKQRVMKGIIHDVVGDDVVVERLYTIIAQQLEY